MPDSLFRMLPVIVIYQLPGGLAAAVMTPAGWFEKEEDPIFDRPRPARLPDQLTPGLKRHDDRIEGADITGKPVLWWLRFGSKSAKDPVPDDQYAAMVPVQVRQVCPVMHPVMRGRVQDKFQRSR